MLGEDVTVAVEDDRDAGVASAYCNLFRVGACGDPQGDGGVAQMPLTFFSYRGRISATE